jgi:hypothetical protein
MNEVVNLNTERKLKGKLEAIGLDGSESFKKYMMNYLVYEKMILLTLAGRDQRIL